MSFAKKYDHPLITFESEGHKYENKITKETYKSVTRILSTVENHFDSESVSLAIFNQPDDKKQEIYIGMTQQEILDYWQLLNDEANIYGSKVHDTLEKYLLANKLWFPDETTEEGRFEQLIIDRFNDLNIDEGEAIFPERILFSEEHKLAGMSDLIIDHKYNFFSVKDYKTNRVLNMYNPYGYETLKNPVSHLQDCQYSIYALQLSIYALMYEMETGRKCRDIEILYWEKEKESFRTIPVIYLKHEARKLIELHKTNVIMGVY